MELMQRRRILLLERGGINMVNLYTKYNLSEDTTLYQLLQAVNYQVHYNDVYIKIRANGSVAPQSGAYTLNNYCFYFRGGNLLDGRHFYKNGRVAPDSFLIGELNEEDRTLSVQNGILVSNNVSSTSCLGTAGDNVVIMEIPFDYNKYFGID